MRSRLAFVLLAAALVRGWSGEPPAEEYRVKGAFLLNFTRFVEWPAEAFKGPKDAIAICILGASPFSADLDLAAKGMVLGNRTVNLRQIPDAQQARACQMVFVSLNERKRVHALLEAVQGGNVLTVGESEGFIAAGGIVEFRLEENKVRMDISEAAAKRAGLRISSRLLSLAQPAKR